LEQQLPSTQEPPQHLPPPHWPSSVHGAHVDTMHAVPCAQPCAEPWLQHCAEGLQRLSQHKPGCGQSESCTQARHECSMHDSPGAQSAALQQSPAAHTVVPPSSSAQHRPPGPHSDGSVQGAH
jgi:hypothetical protein